MNKQKALKKLHELEWKYKKAATAALNAREAIASHISNHMSTLEMIVEDLPGDDLGIGMEEDLMKRLESELGVDISNNNYVSLSWFIARFKETGVFTKEAWAEANWSI